MLRFAEYENQWPEKDLEECITDISYGIGSAATRYDGENKYLRITDIDEGTFEFQPKPLTSPERPIGSQYYLKQGDIVFARTGASTGKKYLYQKKDGKLVYAGFLIKISVSQEYSASFLFYSFQLDKYDKWVSIYSQRSGQPGLNAREYANYKLRTPSLPEQEKIASFLTAVDKKIQLLQKKKELLERYKKGVMQKLFDARFVHDTANTMSVSGMNPDSRKESDGKVVDGKKVFHPPTLRFKDENGEEFEDWEEKKLDEIFIFKKGRQLPKSVIIENGQNACIHYGELFTKYGNRVTSIFSKTNERGVLGHLNDILMPSSDVTPEGLATSSVLLVDKVIIGGDINILRPINTHYNSLIVSYYLDIRKAKILRLVSGTTVKHIYAKDLRTITVSIPPNAAEQSSIISLISRLDSLIIMNIDTGRFIQEWKRGLLQKMFV